MPSLFQFAVRLGSCVELALIEGRTTELPEEADETVNSAGKSATGATSTEEHDTSKDGKGVAREGSDMIKFNWMQRRRKTRNEGAIYML